jgi:hypothetical protein
MRLLVLAFAASANAFVLPNVGVARPAAAAAIRMEDAPPPAVTTPDAYIEFIIGYPEPVVPDVSLTRSRDGSTGVATFTFDNPSFLAAASEVRGRQPSFTRFLTRLVRSHVIRRRPPPSCDGSIEHDARMPR